MHYIIHQLDNILNMNKLELKRIIKLSDLSREEFADKLKISISTLNSWSYRDSKIPKNKVLLIHKIFGNSSSAVDKLPTLKKDGVTVSLDEVFNFILENEKEIFTKHKMFKLWISEKVYKELAEISGKLDSK